jgi:hypothetical protein
MATRTRFARATSHTHPIMLGAAAALNLFGLDLVWGVGALAWATHIATDRALGFGRRDRDGFIVGR